MRLLKKSVIALLCFSFGIVNTAIAEDNQKPRFIWPNGMKNAISLTFDDARPSQADVGLPILDELGVQATFYVMPGLVEERLEKWQQAVKTGHEIGNHTTNHICSGNFEWLRKKDMGLEQWTLADVRKDIVNANKRLKALLGVVPTSFAYPCGHTFVGRGIDTKSYVPVVAELFESSRTWLDEAGNNPTYVDLAQVTGIRMDGSTFTEVFEVLEKMRAHNTWIVLAGHDVGEKAMYTTDTKMLRKLIAYLKDPANGYWLATVDEATTYINKQRAGS